MHRVERLAEAGQASVCMHGIIPWGMQQPQKCSTSQPARAMLRLQLPFHSTKHESVLDVSCHRLSPVPLSHLAPLCAQNNYGIRKYVSPTSYTIAHTTDNKAYRVDAMQDKPSSSSFMAVTVAVAAGAQGKTMG